MVADDKTGFKTYVNQYEQAVIAITEFVRSIKLPKNEQLYFTWFYCGASTAETFLNNRNFTLLESYDIKNENKQRSHDHRERRPKTHFAPVGR